MSMGDAIASVLQPQMSALAGSSSCSRLIRRRVALCFGNERRGASAALRENADSCFYIPMLGFVQSVNVSVAVAIASSAFLHRTPDYSERALSTHNEMNRTIGFALPGQGLRTPVLSQEANRSAEAMELYKRRRAPADLDSAKELQASLPNIRVDAKPLETSCAGCAVGSIDSGVACADRGLFCEGLSGGRFDDILAGWLMSEVPGASELLSRAGVRPHDY